jgi:ribonuclease HII
MAQFERAERQAGHQTVAGVDEAGRGPLAGPVVAAACVIPEGLYFAGVNDSKQLCAGQRADLYQQLTQDPRVQFGIGFVHADEIDRINIYQATIRAMCQAVQSLVIQPQVLLVDGLALPYPNVAVRKVIGGDALCYCIAAASILAKEYRDRLMVEYHQQWPVYGFNRHKGYATEEHRRILLEQGPCPIHRLTFEVKREEGTGAQKSASSTMR